jgi:pimeloyl-ACP methyl ester carboxylesterase
MSPIGVRESPPPRLEGAIALPDGRRLGYAEFGDPRGPLVLWFHGMPGARRQLAPTGRRAADELGLRVVCVERPGVGFSTNHMYGGMRDWARDVAVVADRLGHERFVIAGLSGGGPYAMACAHELPDRVVAIGLLGSLVPTAGEDAAAGGIVALSHRFNGPLTVFRGPLSRMLWGFVRGVNPLAHLVLQGFARVMPPGDQRVLTDPELEAVFIDDLTLASRRQFHALLNDVVLIGRPWGFRLADVRVPVRWWHGDADPFVPLEQAQKTAAHFADVEFHVRPGESHLGDFAAADEVLAALAELWATAAEA